MVQEGYNPENQNTPIDEINEVNGFRNELSALLIRVPQGLTDEELIVQRQKEIQFAIKHNIPLVLQTIN